MNLIKLNAIDSTNSYMKRLLAEGGLEDFTIVAAEMQTEGRGQMGTSWTADAGKNLTFSIFKKIDCVDKEHQFYLSMAVSLAVFKALELILIPQLKIKWPNDILSANRKICGILIENVIKSGKLHAAVIGIGLNVNQTSFDSLMNASSLKLITGMIYDTDEILHRIVAQLKIYERYIVQNEWSLLKAEYEQNLFRKDKPSTFKDRNGALFMGFIKGVSEAGMLQVLLEDQVLREFELKEVKLLY